MRQLYRITSARAAGACLGASTLVHSMAMSRVVGIDLGTRRIGVAVSDGLGLTAQPHSTVRDSATSA